MKLKSPLTPIKRLKRSFFNRDTLLVAQELLGKVIVFNKHVGMITETEAYMGFDDPASHGFKGLTPRTKIMYGPPGYSYVYLIYGIYHCLNFSTEKSGFPAAVLIRGLQLLDNNLHLDGPGKLCKYLNITREHSGIDITQSDEFYVGCLKKTLNFTMTPRIGIKVGLDKQWRYVAELESNET